MSVSAEIYMDTRQTAAAAYGSGQFLAQQNHRGDLCVAPASPPKTELARLGNLWYTAIPTASAYTPVAAMPTTRSELSIRNGYTDTTCLVVDVMTQMSLTSLAAASGCTLLYQVNAAAALTDNTAVLISSAMGRTYGGSVTRALATTTATANKWMALAGMGAGGGTATIGAGLTCEVYGSIIVPAGYTLHTNAVWSTAAGTAITFLSWYEVKLPTIS